MACGRGGLFLEGSAVVLTRLWSLNEPLLLTGSVAGWVTIDLFPWTAVPAPRSVAELVGRAQEAPHSPTPMAVDPAGK